GKHPYGVVVLRIDGRRVDVNIHPQKLRVKILGEGEIIDNLKDAIKEDLQEMVPPPKSLSLGEEVMLGKPPGVVNDNSGGVKVRSSRQVLLPVEGARGVSGVLERVLPLSSSRLRPVERLEKGEVRIIGQFQNRYVLLEHGDELILLDQHAAHERIRLEEAERYFEVGGKVLELLQPIYVELPPGRIREMEERWEELKKLGIAAEPFGDNKVVIRAIPAFIKPSEAKEVLRDFLEGYGGRILAEERERLIDNYSCKGAIKSGESLTDAQIRELVHELFKCRDPYHCAHGRPTMLRISITDLDKAFNRTG
ncbi:MAG: hypothetical protein J7L88_03240, partial [Thermoplasmata archaeon]|nr:hypothetical protein [Thermoplasmata archaeon]